MIRWWPPLPWAMNSGPLGHLNVAESKAQHLTAPQAAEHHGQDHGPVPLRAQRPEQGLDLGGIRGSWAMSLAPGPAARWSSGRLGDGWSSPEGPGSTAPPCQPERSDRVETRDRRHRPCDRPSRQSRLAVADPHHPAIAALMGQEVEDVGRDHLDRLLVDHAEEASSDRRPPPAACWHAAASDELEIRVHERITEAIAKRSRRRGRTHEGWNGPRRQPPPPLVPGGSHVY